MVRGGLFTKYEGWRLLAVSSFVEANVVIHGCALGIAFSLLGVSFGVPFPSWGYDVSLQLFLHKKKILSTYFVISLPSTKLNSNQVNR